MVPQKKEKEKKDNEPIEGLGGGSFSLVKPYLFTKLLC